MRETSLACFFALFSTAAFSQQDYNESAGPEVAYEINTSSPFSEKLNRFSLPKNGTVSQALNNKPLYTVALRNGKMHGTWQSWYQNGLPCDSGRMVRGLPDGEWKHWDSEGRLVAVRHYSADKYQRVKHEMVRPHPKRVAFPLTTLYQRSKREALRYMHVSYSFAAAATRHPGSSLHEWVSTNITSGNAYKPVFDHSLHHGLYLNLYSDGHARDSGYYHDGLRHGLWIHRDSLTNTTLRGSYAKGVKVREWKVYDSNGRLQQILFYNGKGQVKWRKKFQRSTTLE
jgi:antitoxin component YwqK of YwqJK toxin-antitoxin module